MKKKRNILLILLATCNALAMQNKKSDLTLIEHVCFAALRGVLFESTKYMVVQAIPCYIERWKDRLRIRVKETHHTLECLWKVGASEMLKDHISEITGKCTCPKGPNRFGKRDRRFFTKLKTEKWFFDIDQMCCQLFFDEEFYAATAWKIRMPFFVNDEFYCSARESEQRYQKEKLELEEVTKKINKAIKEENQKSVKKEEEEIIVGITGRRELVTKSKYNEIEELLSEEKVLQRCCEKRRLYVKKCYEFERLKKEIKGKLGIYQSATFDTIFQCLIEVFGQEMKKNYEEQQRYTIMEEIMLERASKYLASKLDQWYLRSAGVIRENAKESSKE